jgi:hypothetical protein
LLPKNGCFSTILVLLSVRADLIEPPSIPKRSEKAQLPAEVARSLNLLMTELGLVFGAVDLICTTGGEYVFLEVNPGGEWGMLERNLGLPISEAIAEALLETRGSKSAEYDRNLDD